MRADACSRCWKAATTSPAWRQDCARMPRRCFEEAVIRIQPASASDIPLILKFIRDLAEYEKLSGMVVASEEDIREHLFGSDAVADALLAFWKDAPVGFALYFRNFSTFLGKPGIYLEDLFVEPAYRGKGIGKALLARLAAIAVQRGYG